MKTNNIIPIISGCVALIVSIGFVSEFKNNVNANGEFVALLTTSIPLIALGGCIYLIWKGGK